jgi:adenine deaminase
MFRLAKILAVLFLLVLVGCGDGEKAARGVDADPYADLVLINGYVYTADRRRTVAQAVAVTDGLVSAVGGDDEIRRLQGPDTEVIDLAGRMLLPGLQDAHIHIFGIVEPDVCTLRSRPMPLS